jgi:hypothetical protein
MSLDLATCDAFRAKLQDAFPDVFVGLPHDNERITFPAIVLNLQGSSLLNSPLWTGQLSIGVMQQADDSTAQLHIGFVALVAAEMDGIALDSDVVQLYGIISKTSENQNTDRHWITTLTYTIGYGPTA